ncbi:MAG: hypothetical protein HN383_04175 [Verrucomicrobia bacterium]|jgi:hypothetical protein|nr:hypothetical protein [Verrucomicrobiota bacterium]MBT7698691.1 hypothetical protein [Verrucomicrobiota bacterium]
MCNRLTVRHGAVVAGGLCVLLLAVFNVWQVRRTSGHDLTLRCENGRVTAVLDGADRMMLAMPPGMPGTRVGLYVYHPYGGESHRQQFVDLRVRGGGPGGRSLLRYHLLDEARDGPRLQPDAGWQFAHGRGLWHAGEEGARGIMLLPRPVGPDVDVSVHLQHPADAGLLICADESGNGLVCALRPDVNDMIVFELAYGVPEGVLAVQPLRSLSVWSELLCLAGELGRLGVHAAVAWLLLWLLTRAGSYMPWFPHRRFRLPRHVRGAILFAVPVVLTAWVGAVGLQRVPHVADETAYWFQARIYASGHLWAAVPALPDFFQHDHILMLGQRWLSKYPPMFPLLLAVGMWCHVPWLVNPLLAGVVAVAVYRLAAGWYGRAAGWAAWGLLVSSPFFLLMGGNLMSHMAAATFLLLFLLAGRRALRGGRMGSALLAGAAGGAALLTRPYTALLLGAVALVGGAWWAVRAHRVKGAALLCTVAVVGGLPFAAAGRFWISQFTHAEAGGGIPNVYALYDEADTLGFGPEKGKGWLKTWGTWGHTPAKAVRSVRCYLAHTAYYLQGWPWRLSLMLVPLPLLLCRHRRRYLLLGALMLVLVVGHMAYWATQHIGYGARYWFTAVPLAAVLSGVGLMALVASGRRPAARSAGAGGLLSLLCVAGLMLWNATVYMPKRLREARQYGNVTADLHREVVRRGLQQAVVFVRTEDLLFNDGFFMNDPALKSGPVFARDLGARNRELLDAFPGYEGYVWDKVDLRPLTVADGESP